MKQTNDKPFCLEDKRKYGCIYEEQDIKQAVKLLKEETSEDNFLKQEGDENYKEFFDRIINKIFGES